MPKQLSPEQLAHEIAKRKLAISAYYKTIAAHVVQLRESVGCNVPVYDPETKKTVTIRDNFEEKDQFWKQVPCDRYEPELS